MSDLPIEQLRQLKVGDVVTISKDIFSGRPTLITAPIIKVEKRWGTFATPMITLQGHNPNWIGGAGEDPDFDNCLEMGAHMVVRIDQIGPYKVQSRPARNHFREHLERFITRYEWNHPRYQQKQGVLCGHYGNIDLVFLFALSKLNYDFDDRVYNPEKAKKCWEKAGKPGLIKEADKNRTPRHISDLVIPGHLYVSEKQFCAFVRKNWTRIISTRKEMMADGDEQARSDGEAWKEAMEDLDEVLDRKMGYPGDEEDRALWADQDFEEERAFQNGGY